MGHTEVPGSGVCAVIIPTLLVVVVAVAVAAAAATATATTAAAPALAATAGIAVVDPINIPCAAAIQDIARITMATPPPTTSTTVNAYPCFHRRHCCHWGSHKAPYYKWTTAFADHSSKQHRHHPPILQQCRLPCAVVSDEGMAQQGGAGQVGVILQAQFDEINNVRVQAL